MKFNLFKPRNDDFQNLLDYMGKNIFINNQPATAIITRNGDNYNVSSLAPFKRGDHIVYEGEDFYVMNNPTIKQYESYKGIIQPAEHKLYFNVSSYSGGSYSSFRVMQIPSIAEVTSSLQLQSGDYMSMQTGKITITLQDNALTREIANSLGTSKQNAVIIGGKKYSYEGFDFVDIGLVHINVDTVSGSSFDDFVKGISWEGSHVAWNGKIFDFYNNNETVEPQEPTDPNEQTNVGDITYEVVQAYSSSSADGKINVGFFPDAQAVEHYKVELINASNEVIHSVEVTEDQSVTTLNYNFTGLLVGTYYIKIYTYNGTDYLVPQTVSDIIVDYDSGSGWGGGW